MDKAQKKDCGCGNRVRRVRATRRSSGSYPRVAKISKQEVQQNVNTELQVEEKKNHETFNKAEESLKQEDTILTQQEREEVLAPEQHTTSTERFMKRLRGIFY